MAIVRLRPEDLKRAIASDALSLQFQPQVHAPTGKLVGAEAFVRWPHPAYGMIGPGDIIPLVEQGGFHVDFDRWVIAALCRQIKRWESEQFTVPIVAANLWATTLRSGKAVEMVRDSVMSASVRPDVIEIECPRGTIADKALAKAARELRVLGVRTASEELFLRAVSPSAADFDTLKVGHPLARDLMVTGSSAAEQISAIVDAAHAASARVVADSVETAEQEAALVALGCEIVEGYLYGPEVSAAELKTLASVGAQRADR